MNDTTAYIGYIVGGGLRVDETLVLFEEILNLVHRLAPQAVIAFNSRPDDLAAAAERAFAR